MPVIIPCLTCNQRNVISSSCRKILPKYSNLSIVSSSMPHISRNQIQLQYIWPTIVPMILSWKSFPTVVYHLITLFFLKNDPLHFFLSPSFFVCVSFQQIPLKVFLYYIQFHKVSHIITDHLSHPKNQIKRTIFPWHNRTKSFLRHPIYISSTLSNDDAKTRIKLTYQV